MSQLDELVREELRHAEAKRRKGRNRVIAAVVSVALIGLVFAFLLPKIASYGDVWGLVREMEPAWITALAGTVLLNIVTFGPPWVAALPGLRFLHALRVTLASTALSLVAPGGAAVGMATSFGMLKRWGLQGRPVGLAVAVTGMWNQAFILSCPIVAVAALFAAGGRDKPLELIALITFAVLAVLVAGFATGLQSARLATRVGDGTATAVSWVKRLVGRGPVGWTGESFARFRSEALDLLRSRWRMLTAATLANQLADFVLLVVALRATGISRGSVSLVEAFAAWAAIRVLGSLPITPGGIGVVELGLTGALAGFGASSTEAVTASLVYRAAQIVPILVLGLLSAATWKLGEPRDLETAPES
jgi:uncharacterized membrane protein YbhN (UPF0104 family)